MVVVSSGLWVYWGNIRLLCGNTVVIRVLLDLGFILGYARNLTVIALSGLWHYRVGNPRAIVVICMLLQLGVTLYYWRNIIYIV
jgi:hypothetical protein